MHAEPVASPESTPPAAFELPRRGPALLWFGVQQPLVGLRVVLVRPELRRIAAAPLMFLVTICLLVALGGRSDERSGIEVFYATMLSLAAVPVILFGRTYRRLAAASRGPLGLSPRDAARPSIFSAIGDAIRQAILVAIGLVPVYLLVEWLGEWGGASVFVGLAWLLGLLWALHWISIEALDNARTLAPGTSEADARRAVEAIAGDPWFVRIYAIGPLRMFGGLLRRLSRPWRRELDVLARAPELVLGFGLGVAVLLLVPLGALVFRPAAVVGGVHLLGRLEASEASRACG